MSIEHKTLELTNAELKAGSKGHGRLQGYAATFGNKDDVGDIIVAGAFSETIPFMLTEGFAAYGHDHFSPPIGTFDVVRDDGIGLWVEMDFHSTPRAQEARQVAQERLERGKSVKMSIAYSVLDGGAEFTQDARLLKRLKVYEAGIVNIPANPMAAVAAVKSALGDDVPFADHLTALVDDAKEMTERAKARHELRVKEGRVLSAANRTKLSDLRAALGSVAEVLDELLSATERQKEEEAESEPEPVKTYPAVIAQMRVWDTERKLAALGIRLN